MKTKNKISILQIQYSLAQFLFWMTCCACSGFVAVYLQYKGLSDSMVGLVVSIYCLLSLIAQPLTAKIVTLIPFLTVKLMICFLMILMGIMYGVITFLSMPLLPLLIIFIVLNAISAAVNPLINTFGIEYVNQKRHIDFGLARGVGSMGWAIPAVILGIMIEKYNPDILGYVYIVAAIAMLIVLLTMEDLGHAVDHMMEQKKEKGVFKAIVTDPMIMWVAIGLFFVCACHSISTTFTIDMVRAVGGTERTAGLAQFFGAGSELVGMVAFSIMIKRMKSLQILKICGVAFILRYVIMILAPNIPVLMISYMMQAPTTGLYIPASVYFVNERLSIEKQTQGQSIFYMLSGGLAGCIGCFVGGVVQENFGAHAVLLMCIVSSTIGCLCIASRREKNMRKQPA